MNKKLTVALLLLLFLLLALCWGGGGGPQAAIVECPHDWRWDEKEASDIEAFTGGRDKVPEYNDCQRFVVGSETTPAYDSLFAIFASGSLDTLHAEGAIAGAPAERTGSASALIRAWGSYPDLGIVRGFNCLVLRPGLDSWQAFIVPANATSDCNGGIAVPTAPGPLEVIREPLDRGLFGDGAVPPVARWGFDRRIWKQYIVIKCGDGTCFVGPREFAPYRLDSVPSVGTPAAGDAVFRIDGWHDAQFLAAPPTAGKTELVDPLLYGVVIPDARLGDRTHTDFRNVWVPVAKVAMSAQSDQYADKLNFGVTGSNVLNIVESCLDEGGCPGLPDMTAECKDADTLSGGAWRTRHTNAATGVVTWHCVEYRALDGAYPGLKVPGTARWRWMADDETLWYRCPIGCCKVVP